MNSKLYSGLLGFVLCFGNAIQSMERPGKPLGKRKKEDARSFSDEVKEQRKTDFFSAVREGSIVKMRTLIEKDGTFINATDGYSWYGWQAIHVAAGGGHRAVVEYLLEQSADLNAADFFRTQPIHYAAGYGHREMVAYLLEQGAELNAADNIGTQAIHVAARKGHREVVAYLVEQGADLNATDHYRTQPIHEAARNGHREMVAYLVEQGADLNAADKFGKQPIHEAAKKGHREMVCFLISNGAVLKCLPIINSEINWNGLLLSVLSACGESDYLPMIWLYGLDVEVNLSQLFMMASGQSELATVQAILDDHEDKLSEDDLIQALVGAATAGHASIVDCIYMYMNRDHTLRQRLPEALSEALARAVAQGQLDGVYTIMRRDGIIQQSEAYPDLATDFSLLGRAETLLGQLLARYSASEITINDRLSNYNCIVQTFENRRIWRCSLTSPTTYFNLLPEEVLEHILDILTYNYLHGFFGEGEGSTLTDSSTELEVPTGLSEVINEGGAMHHPLRVQESFTFPHLNNRCTQASIVALCALIISTAYHFSW